MDRYPIGSTAVLDLTIENAGVGVTGESPVAVIQRVSDGKYYGELLVPNKFVSSFSSNDMDEVDSVNLPGLYRYEFNHAHDTTGSEHFYVRFSNPGANARTVDSRIAFGIMRTAETTLLCNLYGTVLDINNNPDANKQVRVSILPNTVLTTGSKPAMSVDVLDTFTNTLGEFSFDIVRGLTVRLQIHSAGYDRKIVIPDASSANFADL